MIEDVWHSVDSLSEIHLEDTELGLGNHTIWVRAVSSEGISAPITIPLNITSAGKYEEELGIESEGGDSSLLSSLSFSFVVFTSITVSLFRSKKT